MDFLKTFFPAWVLRISLGVMYLYSGVDLMRHPTAWHWALPAWLKDAITSVMPLDLYLKFQGTAEIIFAFVLLAWFLKPAIVKWIALLTTLEFVTILVFAFVPWSEANFLITFRDIGLLGASLALFVMLAQKEKSPTL